MQATRRATVRFKERSELLDFLLEVSAATGQTLDLDRLLANVAEIVQRVLHYELFAILLFNEKRRDLRIRYAVGHRAGRGAQPQHRDGRGHYRSRGRAG